MSNEQKAGCAPKKRKRDRYTSLLKKAEAVLEKRKRDDELIERAMDRVKEQRPNWIKR